MNDYQGSIWRPLLAEQIAVLSALHYLSFLVGLNDSFYPIYCRVHDFRGVSHQASSPWLFGVCLRHCTFGYPSHRPSQVALSSSLTRYFRDHSQPPNPDLVIRPPMALTSALRIVRELSDTLFSSTPAILVCPRKIPQVPIHESSSLLRLADMNQIAFNRIVQAFTRSITQHADDFAVE